MMPQVKFKTETFNEAFKTVIMFLNPKNGWNQEIFKVFPELEPKLDGLKKWSEVEKVSKKFFREYYNKNKLEIKNKTKEFELEWKKHNDKFMVALENALEIKWPSKFKKFTCRIGISPVCPRYLDKMTFDIPFFFDKSRMNKTLAHEILHFLYFEKWKEVFPNVKKNEFESPHLVWHLSEMMPKVILNTPEIKKILNYEHFVYDSYENLKINNKPILGYLKMIYKERKDIQDFLKKSFKFVKQNKEKIIK